MTLAERLSAIVNALPDSGAVTLPVAELRQWLAETGTQAPPESAPVVDEERWLTADDVATALRVSKRYVYAQAAKEVPGFPFVKKLPGGGVRFSARGLKRWMERNG